MASLQACLAAGLALGAAASGHPACRPLETYQAAYVQAEYAQERHMGFYYELGFRDLYPGPPLCDCQHTTKRRDPAGGHGSPGVDGDYYENFDFQCGPLPGTGTKPMPILTMIDLNRTTGAPGESRPRAVYKQTITKAVGMRIPEWMRSSFDTGVIAFDRSGAPGEQYNWVIEFTCGGLGSIFRDGFVGLNLYSRTLSSANLDTMIGVVKSLNLSWVLEKGFHKPTHNQSLCTYNTSSSSSAFSHQSSADAGTFNADASLVGTSGVLKATAEAAARSNWLDTSENEGAGPNPFCIALHCGKEMLACELERSMCAKGLSCTQACGKNNNTLACLYGCLNSYEDEAYSNFVRCAITDHHCIPPPPPPKGQIKQCRVPKRANTTFNVSSVLHGRWYIPVGLNPVIDCYPCQYGDWTFDEAGRQHVNFTFKVPTLQGGCRNRILYENVSVSTNGRAAGESVSFTLLAHADGLDQRQNFTVIAAREDIVVAYWCADNNIGSLLEGVNVYTRDKQLPAGAESWVKDQVAAAGLDFARLCQVDNTNHCDS